MSRASAHPRDYEWIADVLKVLRKNSMSPDSVELSDTGTEPSFSLVYRMEAYDDD